MNKPYQTHSCYFMPEPNKNPDVQVKSDNHSWTLLINADAIGDRGFFSFALSIDYCPFCGEELDKNE